MATRIRINSTAIIDWESFHNQFARALGFPEFYGRNMNAWIDCMSSVDDPGEGMTKVTVEKGEPVLIEMVGVEDFLARCPEQFNELIICSALVNQRFVGWGSAPLISLVFL